MTSQRRQLVVGNRIIGSRQHPGLDQFASTLEIPQHGPSGVGIPASGRGFVNDARAVPILGGVGSRFNHDAGGSVVAGGQRCRLLLALRINSTGEAFPFRMKSEAPAGSGLVNVFLNTVPISHFAFCFGFAFGVSNSSPK